MHPVLLILIFAAGFLLWLLCAFMYRPTGEIFKRLFDNAKEEITKEETKGNSEE